MKRLLVMALVLLINACATQAPLKPTLSSAQQQAQWQHHQQALKQLDHWKISGRFGAKNGENAWNGQIVWVQNAQAYKIQLAGPIGMNSVMISGNVNQATLSLGKDEQFSANDAESLLYFHTGLHLPVSGMQYWLTGQMSPFMSEQSYELDSQGLLSHLRQQDWDVQYKDYVDVNGLYLPRKLYVSHPDYQVRLVIDRWNVNG